MKLKPTLTLIALALGALSARAQILFTITARAEVTDLGYTANQSYQFTYTLTPTWTNTPDSSFTATSNSWYLQNVTDAPLFTAIGGSGVSGTYARSSDPTQSIVTNSSGRLELAESGAGGTNIGLTTPSGAPIGALQAYIDTSIVFSTPGSYANPATAFTSVLGSYTPATDPVNNNLVISAGGFGQFLSITGFTITAIPEPSTYGAIFGAAALGFGLWRRRRMKSAAQ